MALVQNVENQLGCYASFNMKDILKTAQERDWLAQMERE